MGTSTIAAPAAGLASAGGAVLDAADAATVAMRRARAAQLDRVHEVVESGRWHVHGYRSPHAWLTTTTGEAPGACGVTLQLAERIQQMPIVKQHFARGSMAESALRLLTDAWHVEIAAAFARDEAMLTGWATRLPHRDFKLVLGAWVMHADPDRAERSALEQYESRKLHVSELMDGMGRLDGLLDAEGTKLVREALTILSRRCAGDERTAEQRRADALVAMATQALATHADTAPRKPGGKRNRVKLLATIAYHDLVEGTRGGIVDTSTGPTVLSAEAIRRLACDSAVHRLVTGPGDTIVNYGRQARTVSDTQFDLLVARDHGCRILGCPVGPDGCDAHHTVHWANNGNTDLDDLALVCWGHHHLLHEQHWKLEPLGAGHFQLTDPTGQVHPLRPPMIGLALPAPETPPFGR